MFDSLRLSYLALLLSLPVLCSCSGNRADNSDDTAESDTIPQVVMTLIESVSDNDSSAFAAIVSYPLQRPYPLKDIEDSVQMKAYFSTLVDDSLRNVISKSKACDWESDGWQGWSLKKGNYVKVDESVYEIPYLSKAEESNLRKLKVMEIESLSPDLRGAWIPVKCLMDESDGTIYRIDSDSTVADDDVAERAVYRLAIYHKGHNLRRHPSKVLRGRRHTEGSAETVSYIFAESCDNSSDADTTTYMIESNSMEDGRPGIYHRNHRRPLNRIYWLDVVPKDTL